MFDWWEFLRVAEEASVRSDTAIQHTAVSRAYYAAFGAAKDWREGTLPFVAPEDGTVHRVLWTAFEVASDDRQLEIGELGNRLRRSRNQADYDAKPHDFEEILADALENAREIRTLLADLGS